MLDENTTTYRERIYRNYESSRKVALAPANIEGFKSRLPYVQKLVRMHIPPDRRCTILDLGCGHGTLLHILQQAGYREARGVDGSPEQVAAARRLGILGVEQRDVWATLKAAPSCSLDVVIAFDFIEHFTKSEVTLLIDAVFRVLKRGGRFIIHTPNAESPFGGAVRYGDFTHEIAFTRVSIHQLLCASGFVNVECFEDCPIPHGLISGIRALLWRVFRAALLFYIAVETGSADRSVILSQNLLAVATKS